MSDMQMQPPPRVFDFPVNQAVRAAYDDVWDHLGALARFMAPLLIVIIASAMLPAVVTRLMASAEMSHFMTAYTLSFVPILWLNILVLFGVLIMGHRRALGLEVPDSVWKILWQPQLPGYSWRTLLVWLMVTLLYFTTVLGLMGLIVIAGLLSNFLGAVGALLSLIPILAGFVALVYFPIRCFTTMMPWAVARAVDDKETKIKTIHERIKKKALKISMGHVLTLVPYLVIIIVSSVVSNVMMAPQVEEFREAQRIAIETGVEFDSVRMILEMQPPLLLQLFTASMFSLTYFFCMAVNGIYQGYVYDYHVRRPQQQAARAV